MLKRLKVWTYLAVAFGASLYAGGCSFGGWWPYNTNLESWPRIIAAILNEELLG